MVLFPPAPGGGEKVDYGYKGKGVLLHLLIDKNGNAIAITTTDAQGDEKQEVSRLLTQLPLKSLKGRVVVLEADKGYDAGWLRQLLLNMGIFPLIPYRKIKGRWTPEINEVTHFFKLSPQRWKVERAFAWLKRRCRRLLMRWERLFVIWNGLVILEVVYTWVKNLVG
jgi:transposase